MRLSAPTLGSTRRRAWYSSGPTLPPSGSAGAAARKRAADDPLAPPPRAGPVTLSEPVPPTLDELRARPTGRTGAQLIARLRLEGLLADYDPVAEVWRVATDEGLALLVLGTNNVVHSAVVSAAIAAVKGWALPAPRAGYTNYPPEPQPHGATIHAVRPNDRPELFGLGATGAAAYADLARIREAVDRRTRAGDVR